jgi:hypothetical protein
LVVTNRADEMSINRAHSLRAEYVCSGGKEVERAVSALAIRIELRCKLGDAAISEAASELGEERGLTNSERVLVATTATQTLDAEDLAKRLGIRPRTLKDRKHAVTVKTGSLRFEEATIDVLQRALRRKCVSGE